MSMKRTILSMVLVGLSALTATIAIFGVHVIPGPGIAVCALICIAAATTVAFIGRKS